MRVAEPWRIAAGPGPAASSSSLDPRRDAVHRRRRPHGPGHGRRGHEPLAMANRRVMLERLLTALEHPRVDGVLAQPGRAGGPRAAGRPQRPCRRRHDEPGRARRLHAGSSTTASPPTTPTTCWRPTSTPARCCCASTVTMPAPCRPSRPAPAPRASSTTAACWRWSSPSRTTTDADGRAVPDPDPIRLVQAVGACAAFGSSSAYTWLKIQATADIADRGRRHHPTAAAARWGAGARSLARRSRPGSRGWPSRRCVGWWSGGRCSTRPTATSRPPSARPPSWSSGRRPRGHRDEHAPVARPGRQRPPTATPPSTSTPTPPDGPTAGSPCTPSPRPASRSPRAAPSRPCSRWPDR